MGLILDSTVLISGERRGLSPLEVLEEVSLGAGGSHFDFAISAVSVAELAHGAMRAKSDSIRSYREEFLKELIEVSPVIPIAVDIALRAGHIGGLLGARGIQIGMADLLIGAPALNMDYSIATANIRHFSEMPGLRVQVM